MHENPFRRTVKSPLTAAQLTPLDPRCQVVQFEGTLTPKDSQKLADFLEDYPGMPLRAFSYVYAKGDLEFLQFFPRLQRFAIDSFKLQNLDGLRYLSDAVVELHLGQIGAKKLSLRPLERFPYLRTLAIDSIAKDIEIIGTLKMLEDLTLRSVTLPGLDFLKPCQTLSRLAVKLGGTRNLAAIPEIGELKRLELWLIRGLDDVGFVARLPKLQLLILQALKQVQTLPSFGPMKALRRIHLETMKGLTDLAPIAKAPALEELVVHDAPQLEPEAFRPFVGHPTLRRTSIAINSIHRNEAVAQLLGLPKCDPHRFELQ